MTLLPGLPEAVPFEEVAEVLAAAASRVQGGPPALIGASSRHLAAALELAGFPRRQGACRWPSAHPIISARADGVVELDMTRLNGARRREKLINQIQAE